MPCDTRLRPGVNPVQRMRQIAESVARLEAALSAGSVTITIGPTGAIAFRGWSAEVRDDVTDVCAYRRLSARSSWALRQAVARAEATSGRRVSLQAVAAGVHSHDDGKTWGSH